MSARKRFYQATQLRVRGIRLSVSQMEDNAKFDPALHTQLELARTALERAEESCAVRLADETRVA